MQSPSRDVSELLSEALKLPAGARAEMAGSLLSSLDDGEDEGVAEAWEAEITRRLEEIDSGRVRPIPWTEVRRRLGL